MTGLLMRSDPLAADVTRLFEGIFGPADSRRWVPPMDLLEREDAFVLRADLPGMGEEDISIEFENGLLTVAGERRAEAERSERGWHRIERSFGRFTRTLSLPEGVDPDAIEAAFDRGVLEVRVPKPEARKPRRIEIRPGGGPATIEGEAKAGEDTKAA